MRIFHPRCRYMRLRKKDHSRQGMALLLCLAMMLSMLPALTWAKDAAGGVYTVEEDTTPVETAVPQEGEADPSGESGESGESGVPSEGGGPLLPAEGFWNGVGLPRELALKRLRAGRLTKDEVDELIAQGLTLADLMDPYAIAPLAITQEENDIVGEGIVDA